MSLTGFVDQTSFFNALNSAAASAVKDNSVKYTTGPVTTGSRIVFDATTKSQVNDWISSNKLTASAGGVSVSVFTHSHLVSW